MKIVFVHGRSQQGKNKEDLLETWKNSFYKGLKEAKLESLQFEFFFPFYGDLLIDLIDETEHPIKEALTKGDSLQSGTADFYFEFLEELAKSANISDQEISEYCQNKETKKGALNWEWVHAILIALDQKTSLGGFSIELFTNDVYQYLTNKNIRERIKSFVVNQIPTDDEIILVGHSLGSVVSYDLLRSFANLRVNKFVTVGSPLGLTAIKKYLPTPLEMPQTINTSKWFNAFDKRDVVALLPLDAKNFPIAPPIKNFGNVNNHTPNRHGIEGYLEDGTLASQIVTL